MANPFYVQPVDMSRSLAGLGQTMQVVREQREQEAVKQRAQQRFASAKQDITKAWQSGDPMQVAQASLEYPEFQQVIQQQVGIMDKAKKQDASMFATEILNAANDPQRVVDKYNQRIKYLEDNGRDATHTKQSLQDYLTNPQAEMRDMEMFFASTDPDLYKTYKESTAVKPAETRELKQGDRIITQEFDSSTGQWNTIADAGRFNPNAGTTVNVGTGGDAAPIETPQELLKGLPEDVAAKTDAVYRAAGGGKDGLDAINKLSDKMSEQDRRAQSANILQSSFPNATPEEMEQLKSAMDAAENTEAGLKQAREVREDQRKNQKGRNIRDRAAFLIQRIINNPQLDDVLGSIEGRYDIRPFSDEESELIADINEVENLLTVENLGLMSGVLSESDLNIIKAIGGGGLNRKRSKDSFLSDTKSLLNGLTGGAGSIAAPPAAVEYLRSNPQFAEQFKQKYGYLPEGM